MLREAFVVADVRAGSHDRAEGALNFPTMGQVRKAFRGVRTRDRPEGHGDGSSAGVV